MTAQKLLKLLGYLTLSLVVIGFFVRDLPKIAEYVKIYSIQFRDTSILTFNGHSEVVRAVVFSPDGNRILSGGLGSDRLRLWDVKSGELVRSFTNEAGNIRSLAFSADGREIFVGGDRKIQMLEIETSTIQRTINLTGKLDGIDSMAFSPVNRSVLVGSKLFLERNLVFGDQYFGVTSVVDFANGNLPKRLPGIWRSVPVVRFSADGKWALAAGARNQYSRIGKAFQPLVLWDVATWSPVGNIEVANIAVYAAAFSPDSSLIASAGSSSKIKLWSVKRKTSVRSFAGHTGSVHAVKFSQNGKLLISGGSDATVKLWSIATGGLVNTFVGHLKSVTTIAISPDGKTMVSGSDDKTLKLWDISAKPVTLPIK